MRELEYKVLDARINGDGKPAMSIEAGALAFEVTGESGEGEGSARVCAGVQLAAQFPENSAVDVDEVMARANRTLRPAKLFRAGAGVVHERYLIMDGGISRDTILRAAEAGADVFVAGSAVYSAPEPAAEIDALRNLARITG
jgi:hypothetical protein